ncbi:DedA family protein [Kerstersia gyiorum]|uniref:DedA family protein n=1 Tax=Kerstersia gyiorum TaxID=206506 RepID=UPI0020A1EF97|nr:DedA family protein [Kerstersia gyiorum]MCP1634763.1 membrane-associated protein [Kerstersia gyiorum]MCP1638204.1 membrane-associated protein [Kerstersia gyiorum]MCP1672538.1 membrane-associated protein [Kerstersia gyiorum]MCP1680519.1 membrane-associated protein [Kerstersia gyiorum]MCP1683827.1 membrane-associated protein [Kerstersia gyiorum]
MEFFSYISDFFVYLFDFILHIDAHLAELIRDYGVWVYLILFLIIFCETGLVVTPFLPGDSLLFMTGAFAALPDTPLNVHGIALLLLAAAILGDTVNYTIGKYFGAKLFSNPDSRLFKRSHLMLAEQFYQRHGRSTIIIARFAPIVRTFAPFVAGMSRMHYRTFMLFNMLGAVLWVVLFVYAGYLFGNLPIVRDNLTLLALAIIAISVLLPMAQVWIQRRRGRKLMQAANNHPD